MFRNLSNDIGKGIVALVIIVVTIVGATMFFIGRASVS